MGDAVAGDPRQIDSVNQDLAFGYRLSQIKKLEQGGLAGTAGAADENELIFGNVQGNIDQGFFGAVIVVNVKHPAGRGWPWQF